MTRKDLVTRAIEFRNPDRVPIWFFNRDQLGGDILTFELSPFRGGEVQQSEWGYVWDNLGDGTIGCPRTPVIPSWNTLDSFPFPNTHAPTRFHGLEDFLCRAEDRYRIAELGITGFTTYCFLRGVENGLVDFLLDEEKAGHLLDKIMEFENELIELAAAKGFHGVHFADDWGSQRDIVISPTLWRRIFKPRYKRQFDLVRRLGMHSWFHSCGNVASIIPDLNEIGVSVMNIAQPNAVDVETVGELLRGKQCFEVPISYQTVSISGSPEEIQAEARRLYAALGTERGGFLGYVEEFFNY
jgi:uroporphyrinogen decarboxylase